MELFPNLTIITISISILYVSIYIYNRHTVHPKSTYAICQLYFNKAGGK